MVVDLVTIKDRRVKEKRNLLEAKSIAISLKSIRVVWRKFESETLSRTRNSLGKWNVRLSIKIYVFSSGASGNRGQFTARTYGRKRTATTYCRPSERILRLSVKSLTKPTCYYCTGRLPKINRYKTVGVPIITRIPLSHYSLKHFRGGPLYFEYIYILYICNARVGRAYTLQYTL